MREIRHATALEQFGSFSRAAEDLGLAQPTLSRSIQALESSLGVRLFDRGPRGVVPTDAGRLFLSHAARIRRDVSELEHSIERLREVDGGTLDVGVGLWAASALVGPTVARLSARHPRLRVVVRSHPWQRNVPLLRSDEFELVLGDPGDYALDPDLEIELVAHEPVVAICRAGHPLLSKSSVDVQSITCFPIVAPFLPRAFQRWLCEEAGFDDLDQLEAAGVPALQCDNPEALLQIVSGSEFVGFSMPSVIRRVYESNEIEILPLSSPPPRKEYALIRLKDRTPSPAAEAFAACVRVAATEVTGASLAGAA